MSNSARNSKTAVRGPELAKPATTPTKVSATVIDLAETRRRRGDETGRQPAPPLGVRIYRLDHRPKQQGQARRPWVLECEPTKPTRTDPLMGWIGWSDPRQQVRLLFSTKARAVAFAERQGWACDASEAPTNSAGLVDEIRQAAARPVSFAGLSEWHAVM